ncbi:unnamed protein product [Toxocara canis]|uniref:Sushi domain-containing protein n=1 Tax=Toxocara canis TaxID=6265 RepID=A0A183U0G0_TOXCA|nr:unnamed protein product [Toxocara canis]
MTDKEETSGGEQDDISFLRTGWRIRRRKDEGECVDILPDRAAGNPGDIVAMTCLASSNREGVLGSERVCLCTEGFGNRMCLLENVSDRVSLLLYNIFLKTSKSQ